MPANLPPEAKEKWLKVMEAKTLEEKIKALEEFISAVPKHKGTENLLYWARRRLRELREEQEERRRRRASGRGPTFFIEKEGAAQIVLLGLTNVGKSLLLRRLTNADVEVADYPYTTRRPVPGMLQFEDIQFQLIEAPALMPGAADGVAWGTKVLGLARNADGIIIVLDAANRPLHQLKIVLEELRKAHIHVVKPRGRVVIEKGRGGSGIRVALSGRLIDCTVNDIMNLLKSYRIYNALVKVYGEVTIDDVEKAIFGNIAYKPTIILVNKMDLVKRKIYEKIRKVVPKTIPVLPVSAKTGEGLYVVGKTLFDVLEIIRVYTKQPNHEKPSEHPLILRKGATVYDVAKAIHSSFVENFKYAKIWGPSAKYPGERVGLDHEVMDKDTVEIHVK
ncbi:MAG TPA: TGS domain-containing protein [Desulfurococcaceae archaeon]|nr:TGS domain-containing protein [Desulfurococcaceae archaeon]